jgi:hypothetical protein
MRATQRPNRITIDLQGYKQQWLDYCRERKVSPSDAFRQIVAKLTASTATTTSTSAFEEEEKVKVRREIRLTVSELTRAEVIAQREGFSLTRWIVALINARLDAKPQLGQQELELLARSNLQMLVIGRNLNQLARAANSGASPGRAATTAAIAEVRAGLMQHAHYVAGVMSSNVSRWGH